MLENVSPTEQARRDALHAGFCAALINRTEVLSFAFRGRRRDRLIFREFISKEALSSYCTPNGGKTLRHRQFHVVLPELAWGSPPFLRTLTRRPIEALRSVHVEAKEVQH